MRDWRRQAEEHRRAVHESGHAVIAIALGLPVRQVDIRCESDRGGACWIDLNVAVEDVAVSLFATTIFLLAGGAAERRLGIAGAACGDGPDRAKAARIIAMQHRLTVDQIERLLRRCDVLTSVYVTNAWPWIQRTADALTRRRVLDGDVVLALRDEEEYIGRATATIRRTSHEQHRFGHHF
jgi:hypothetical protein